MKNTILSFLMLCCFIFQVFAYEIPKPTEDEGMNKLERINKIEKDVIELSEEVSKLKNQIKDLKQEIKEEILRELKNK